MTLSGASFLAKNTRPEYYDYDQESNKTPYRHCPPETKVYHQLGALHRHPLYKPSTRASPIARRYQLVGERQERVLDR